MVGLIFQSSGTCLAGGELLTPFFYLQITNKRNYVALRPLPTHAGAREITIICMSIISYVLGLSGNKHSICCPTLFVVLHLLLS